ncbi:hypothetical protein FRC10_012055 [Ceratobasidium sp. 414]|nr:hypothetical protein FRC10_012055 [Ceratobasidium sp. 414]
MRTQDRVRRYCQTGPHPKNLTSGIPRKRSQSMEQVNCSPCVARVARAAVESDSESISADGEDFAATSAAEGAMDMSEDRLTRPLPVAKRRVIPTNLTMVPVQPTVPRTPVQQAAVRIVHRTSLRYLSFYSIERVAHAPEAREEWVVAEAAKEVDWLVVKEGGW